jgi:hypothetical protein
MSIVTPGRGHAETAINGSENGDGRDDSYSQ